MAVFTWTNMAYCCPDPGGWSVQVILYPNGNFSIYQIAATTSSWYDISIGYSDGSLTDNSIVGATFTDWDGITVGQPFSVGQVDFGADDTAGMNTGRLVLFEYNATTGYTATVVQ